MSKLNYHIDQITRKVFREKNFALADLITEWQIIVNDKELAENCTPIKVAFPAKDNLNGTLHIQTESAFATILQQRESDIIDKISAYFGYKAVKRIKIIHK